MIRHFCYLEVLSNILPLTEPVWIVFELKKYNFMDMCANGVGLHNKFKLEI